MQIGPGPGDPPCPSPPPSAEPTRLRAGDRRPGARRVCAPTPPTSSSGSTAVAFYTRAELRWLAQRAAARGRRGPPRGVSRRARRRVRRLVDRGHLPGPPVRRLPLDRRTAPATRRRSSASAGTRTGCAPRRRSTACARSACSRERIREELVLRGSVRRRLRPHRPATSRGVWADDDGVVYIAVITTRTDAARLLHRPLRAARACRSGRRPLRVPRNSSAYGLVGLHRAGQLAPVRRTRCRTA